MTAFIFNFIFGAVAGALVLGLLCFSVDVLQGVTSFLRRAFIALEAIVVLIELIEFSSTVSTFNVLLDNKSTSVMSPDTSATVLCTSYGLGLWIRALSRQLKVVGYFLLLAAQSNLLSNNQCFWLFDKFQRNIVSLHESFLLVNCGQKICCALNQFGRWSFLLFLRFLFLCNILCRDKINIVLICHGLC